MKNLLSDEAFQKALIALATACVSALTGMIVRKKEKSSMRRRGELKDGKF